MKRIAAAAAVLLLLSAIGYSATSGVADAVMRGDKGAVEKLIAQHADINAPQADGATALQWAVYQSDQQMVDLLLKNGANPKAANREGSTPLWLAAITGKAGIMTALLNAGADANEKLPLGRTPLMEAARTGDVDTIKALLDHGAQINAKETLRGTTALMWAADEGHAPAITLLIQRGADIKAQTDPAERGRGPALGKANDPRKQVAAQGAALAAGKALDLGDLSSLRGDNNGIGGGGGGRGRGAAQGAAAGGGGGRAGRGGGRGGGGGAGAGAGDDNVDEAAVAAGVIRRGPAAPKDGGGLTPLIFAVRSNDLDSVKALLAAGADINQTSLYGWSPLLTATQNRFYKLGAYMLDHGADVNLANKGGWTPLYLATDNRNIESGDYPVRKPDMDHLDYIKLLLAKGANVNARMKDSTETRTVFTNQWLDENGATAFLRASQSGDVVLMKLLLAHGADPKINTVLHVTPLQVAAGIGWVEGITYEWSPESTLEAVKMLIDLGLDVNAQADTGRTAMHGAAHKGATAVVQVLYDHGAKLDIRDYGNTDNRGGKLAIHTWEPVDYSDGLVRVGVQSAIAHPETGLLIRQLMTKSGLQAPPMGRTLESICITDACE
ncbi:MAG TPA: ankyrin repeat domain-containing protein [Bryobacteraceae bacterium]|jgi:ankyrin repeat protein|nr:ankyrin repeat domain-containing protein [Bryobacteraceae bacterium]